MTPQLSIAVCVKDEDGYIENLMTSLISFIYDRSLQEQVEIVVIDDFSENEFVVSYLQKICAWASKYDISLRVVQHALNGDFAEHKNFMNSQCRGEWILNLDADETLPAETILYLMRMVTTNPAEAYWLPRVNTVAGLTLRDVAQWGWLLTTLDGFESPRLIAKNTPEAQLLIAHRLVIDENETHITRSKWPVINWPDVQMRLYKNSPQIKWVGKVHERLTGFSQFGVLPHDTFFAIRHMKDITRQRRQNALYDSLMN